MIQNNHFSSFSVGKKEFFSRNDMTCCREKLTVKVSERQLAALQRYSAVGEKIRRIGKNHVKLEIKAMNGIAPFFVSDCLYLSEKHVIFVASLFLFLNLINENR